MKIIDRIKSAAAFSTLCAVLAAISFKEKRDQAKQQRNSQENLTGPGADLKN
jgi:hypothetical protein